MEGGNVPTLNNDLTKILKFAASHEDLRDDVNRFEGRAEFIIILLLWRMRR